MQQDAETILKNIVRAERADPEDIPDPPPLDFGLYHPLSYVISTWNEHRQHGNYPEPGGYNDQDPRLVEHDWRVIGERFGYLMMTYDEWKYEARTLMSTTRDNGSDAALDFNQLFG